MRPIRWLFILLSLGCLVAAVLSMYGYPLLGSRWLTVGLVAAVLAADLLVLGPGRGPGSRQDPRARRG